MMFKSAYRLGEYQITEDDHGLLQWEKHLNFGVQRSGKCFIHGRILILGDCSQEESGYLQLEFSELLNKLPIWNRTHYYCLVSELLDVSTGQSLTNDFLKRYIALTRDTGSNPGMNMSPGMFRLGRHQITTDDKGEVSWQTYEGLDRIVGGYCIIESALLLIGPQEYEEANQSKRKFLNRLNQLPEWDKTMAWCRSSVLRPCKIEVQQIEDPNPDIFHQYVMNEYPFDDEPSLLHSNQSHFNRYKKPSQRLLQFNFKWPETVWRWICGGRKGLKYLIPLVLIGLLLSLLLIWYSAEKKYLFPHGGKQHHREHHD